MFSGIIVPGEIHPPHRHTSVALNYYTAGHGFSIVNGEKLEWGAGDLQLTPAWAPHGHGNDGNETVWGLTIQDTTLLYGMRDSLVARGAGWSIRAARCRLEHCLVTELARISHAARHALSGWSD